MKVILVEKLNNELDDYTERVVEIYRYAKAHGESAKILTFTDQSNLRQIANQFGLPGRDVVSLFDFALGTYEYDGEPLDFWQVPRPPLSEVASGFRDGTLRDGSLVYANLDYFYEPDSSKRYVSAMRYRNSQGGEQTVGLYDYRGFKYAELSLFNDAVVKRDLYRPTGELAVTMLYDQDGISLIRWYDDGNTQVFTSEIAFKAALLQRAQAYYEGGLAMIDRPQEVVDVLNASGLTLAEQLVLGGNAYHYEFDELQANAHEPSVGVILNGGILLHDEVATTEFLQELSQPITIINTGIQSQWVRDLADAVGAEVIVQNKQHESLAQLVAQTFDQGDIVFVYQTNTRLDNIYRTAVAHQILTIDLGTNIYNRDFLDSPLIFQEDQQDTTRLNQLMEENHA